MAKLILAQELKRARNDPRGLSIEDLADSLADELEQSGVRLLVKELKTLLKRRYGQQT